MYTIDEAKDYLSKNWEQGVECPCCKQMVKLYQRKLTTTMALGLIDLYKQTGGNTDRAVHIKKISIVNGGEFAQMKRWDLIDDETNDQDNKRTSGLWHITPIGIDFVLGRSQTFAYMYTYNGKTIRHSTELIDIKHALGDKFNYREMMGDWYYRTLAEAPDEPQTAVQGALL